MNFLNRDQYNRKIKELNKDSRMQDMALEQLTDLYNNLFCNLSDYEEIVMLINICIAEDRANRLEELYGNYSKLKKMLEMHGDYAIQDYDIVLYCMGVFSFKFHDYSTAIEFFGKCEKQIVMMFPVPCTSVKSDIYIKAKVLMSYSMEYEWYLRNGPLKAINNILNNSLDITEKFEQQFIGKIVNQPKEVIEAFFEHCPSDIYEMASESMKKEILHLFAHCFSEYATELKTNKNNSKDYKRIYLFEELANSFISFLGSEMVTCKAIILSEHGLYWSALEEMEKQYQLLPKSEEKKKAELAFYIYYFRNQIGSDHVKSVEEHKKFFLDYASKENGDTKVYAWIVQFREKLAKALQINGEEVQKLLALEEFVKSAKRIDENQGYLHPQILREKNRLFLAYQILRSYLAINDKKAVEDQKFDNSLFEKCVLFSKQNGVETNNYKEEIDWSNNEYLIELHNVWLSVVGLTKEIHSRLEKEFCTKIPIISDSYVKDHKVIICNSDEQLYALGNMEKSHLILFIYCSENYRLKIKKIVGENVYVETDLVKAFKVAYIQEILEQCYQFAYRWDEFFIMAPITDNSTFAFQNQGIENFLEIKSSVSDEKELFSEDNGYITNEFRNRNIVPIPYDMSLIRGATDITRVFYFSGNCLYYYRKNNGVFTPYKILRNLDCLKKAAYKLHKSIRRNNKLRNNCECKQITENCLCDEWRLDQNPDIYELLMRFSVAMPSEDEYYYTLVWSEKNRSANSLEDFLIVMSKKPIKSYSLRELLYKLLDNFKITEQNGPVSSDTQYNNNIDMLQSLLNEIQKYMAKFDKKWPENSADFKETILLVKDIQSAIDQKGVDKYEDFCSRWEKITSSNPL